MQEVRKWQVLKWLPSLFFVKGLLHVLLFVVMLIMLRQTGMSVAETTLSISLLYLPWVTKWLWKQRVLDVLNCRHWILLMELLLVPAFLVLTFVITETAQTLALLFVIACFTAIHNVSADEFFRQTHTEDEAHGLFTVRELARKTADVFGIGLLVMFVGNLQVIYRFAQLYSWRVMAYIVSTLLLLLFFWHLLNLPQHRNNDEVEENGAISVSDAVFLVGYILVPTMVSKLSVLFLVENQSAGGIGLSPQEFGFVMGTIGVLGVTIGITRGMKLFEHYGTERLLKPMAILMVLPAFVYSLLSSFLPDSLMIVCLCVFLEQTAYGFGISLYIKRLKKNDVSKSIMAASMMIGCALSGLLESQMGFANAFLFILFLEVLTIGVSAYILQTRYCK